MIDGKIFAMFFNASPRKNWNTHKMLESARSGAEEAGATTELVNLYDVKFPGCKSCFACKLKNAKTNGVCAIRDDLRPILERARQADVLVLGSPVYFHYPTGVYRAFLERLAFPVYSYHYENGQPLVCRDKVVETANVFTMNCPEDMMKNWNYPMFLQANTDTLSTVFGVRLEEHGVVPPGEHRHALNRIRRVRDALRLQYIPVHGLFALRHHSLLRRGETRPPRCAVPRRSRERPRSRQAPRRTRPDACVITEVPASSRSMRSWRPAAMWK